MQVTLKANVSGWMRSVAEAARSAEASMRQIQRVCGISRFSWEMVIRLWELRWVEQTVHGRRRHGAVKHARDELRAARKKALR